MTGPHVVSAALPTDANAERCVQPDRPANL
jgi:hypothetical protein